MGKGLEHTALRIAAFRRLRSAGLGFHPPITQPRIVRCHIDGPYLSALDGSILWLSPWERLLTKLRIWDAWDIEWRRFPLPETKDA